ncbi:hypothetical protein HDE_01068 [Halotydeus destructor]|nr:hypothetical protein HDE_01068 [Halotydeus destructor]
MVNTLIIEGYEPFLHASCTGSLIEDDFVITAAHCFDSYARNKEGYPELRNDVPVYMSFGIDCKHPVATREVLVVQNVTVFIHPGYRKGAATGSVTDIALVKLEKPIQSFILPENGQFTNETKLNTVCWRNAKYFDYENTCELLYFAGYGSNDDVNKTVSEALRWTVLNILKFPSYEYVTDTVMYMVNAEHFRLRNTCPGDSGGPFTQLVRTTGGPAQLYDQVSNYTAVLVSTLIGGSVPCIAQAQSSATRVGHPLVYSWIVDVLDNNVGPLKQELNYGPIRFDYKKYIRLM